MLVDRMNRATQEVFADKSGNGEWRVESFGTEGECYVTLFAGPEAELRARYYARFCKPLEDGGLDYWNSLTNAEQMASLSAARDATWACYVAALELKNETVEALEAIGFLPEGYCFCYNRTRDALRPEVEHTGECREARAVIRKNND